METKTIKISTANYKTICGYAGELQKNIGEPISVDRALTFLLHRNKLSDLAGSWKMDDKEADEVLSKTRRGWKKWTIGSA